MKITVSLSTFGRHQITPRRQTHLGLDGPVGRARVISKPVIVAMIPEPLAIGIDRRRVIASGEWVFRTNGSRGGFLTSNVRA